MPPHIAVGLGVGISTMAIAVLGASLRRRAKTGASTPALPRWVLVAVSCGGVLLLLAVLWGLFVIVTPGFVVRP